MANVTFRKGLEENLPTDGMAEEGCVYHATDSGNAYIGSSNGSLIPLNRSPYYGTSSTGSSTNSKVVTLDTDVFSLYQGVMITVKFANANTASSPTINVNSTGAIAVKLYGTTAAGNTPAKSWNAGEAVTFVYDGSYWLLVGGGEENIGHLNTNNTTALTPSASESFTGDINLHKVSKTGSYNDLNDKPTIPSSGDFVTSLGTNGNNVTWTKNGVTNNLTVPYATNAGTAAKLGNSTVGASDKPIYLNSGTPTAVSNVLTSLLKEPNNISISPTSMPLVQTARGNRLALLPASQVIIEKTTDGGTTWVDAGVSDTNKEKLFLGNATSASSVNIPIIDGVRNKLCGLRITITGMRYNVPDGTLETQKYNYWNKDYVLSTERYCSLDGLYIWLSSSNDYIRTRVYRAPGNYPDNWTSVDRGSDMYLSGWSGGNYVFLNGSTFGGGTNQTANYWNYRIVFFTDGYNGGDLSTTSNTYSQNILRISGYGRNGWTLPNNLSAIDHLYSWDSSQMAIFPNAVKAESFIKTGGTSSQFLKADGSIDSNTYATTSQLPSLPLSIANGGTGKTTAEAAANALIGGLPTWTADPSDDVYLIRRDTGGSLSFGQVKFSTVWNYIKSKIASILGIGGSNGIPTAPTAAAGTNTTQIATTAFVGSATSGLAIDDEVVHKAGAETITGEKTFEANVNLKEGATLNMVYDSQTPDGVYLQATEPNGIKAVSFNGISDDGMVQIKNVYVPTEYTDATNKYYVDESILDIDEYRVYLACKFGPYGVQQKSLCAFCLTDGGREMTMTSFTQKSGIVPKEVITGLVFPIGCKIYYNDGMYDSAPNLSSMANRYYTSFNGVDVRYSAVTGTNISLGNYPTETQSTVYLHVIVENGYWKPYYKEGATNEIIVDSFHMQSGNFYIYLGKTVRNTGYMIQLEDNNPLYYYDGTNLIDWASFQADTNYSSIQQDLSNYYTKSETYSQDEVDALLNGMSNFEYVVIQPPDALPRASSSTMGKMYIYNGHRWVTVENNGSYSWVDLGSYDIDLSDYVTNEDFEEALEDRPTFQLVTETQMQNMLDNETWEEGVIYYTVED